MSECLRAEVHLGRGGGKLCWCKCIKFMVPCSTLGMTCSQMETISLFHILLSVIYPHLNKLAELHSAAYRLFYHGKLFHFIVSEPCCEAPVTPVLPETSFFFFLPFPTDTLFPSAQLVNTASNLCKTASGNSNDVGRSKDALTILLICLSGSKTPVFLMENLTCSICIFSSMSSSSSGQF